MSRLRPATIAVGAVLISLLTFLTLYPRIPIPGTPGYLNFGDVAVYFSGFAFGPVVGLIAGGVGTGLADQLSGYTQFAAISFLAHGLQGLLAGWLSREDRPLYLFLGVLAGAAAMMAVYFAAELSMFGVGVAVTELPYNLLQNVVGAAVGIPLYYYVRRAYPPILHMGRPQSWREG